jgi:hypothetical protein
MMKNLKSIGLFLSIPLCALLFYACTQDIPDEAGRPSIVPSENDDIEPETTPRPRVYEVFITLTNEATGYTPEDFSEVPLCTKFTRGTKRISFKAWVNSREQMIEILGLLNEREDVESASSSDLRLEIALERACEKRGVAILDDEIKWQIQRDLWDELLLRYPDWPWGSGYYTPEEYFNIPRYYGTYDGYVVIVSSGNYFAIIDDMGSIEIINGIRFDESWTNILYPGIIVWKDGSFSTMTALYEQDVLTREDVLTIKDTRDRVWEAVREAFKNM